jgi:hypothetical protein
VDFVGILHRSAIDGKCPEGSINFALNYGQHSISSQSICST